MAPAPTSQPPPVPVASPAFAKLDRPKPVREDRRVVPAIAAPCPGLPLRPSCLASSAPCRAPTAQLEVSANGERSLVTVAQCRQVASAVRAHASVLQSADAVRASSLSGDRELAHVAPGSSIEGVRPFLPAPPASPPRRVPGAMRSSWARRGVWRSDRPGGSPCGPGGPGCAIKVPVKRKAATGRINHPGLPRLLISLFIDVFVLGCWSFSGQPSRRLPR